MTRAATFTQRDVATLIAGAIKGGMTPGTFTVEVSARTGALRLLPAKPVTDHDDAELSDELQGFARKNGFGPT